MTGHRIVEVDPAWREAHPGANVGLIAIRGVTNPASNDRLHELASALEDDLRTRLQTADR
jgi:hypothetical protein